MESVPYRETLGLLIFLSTLTRPDLATAVSMLGKIQAEPARKHWQAMKHVIRYLIGTVDYGIYLPGNKSAAKLTAWSDADWVRDLECRRSRSGYILTVGGGPVVWTSRLQGARAVSTSEAEFIALSLCTREVSWVRSLLKELGEKQIEATVIFQDNLGFILWTEEVQGLRKVKHVDIRYHYVRTEVENKIIAVEYTSSTSNRADSLTKALVGTTFNQHRPWLGCISSRHLR